MSARLCTVFSSDLARGCGVVALALASGCSLNPATSAGAPVGGGFAQQQQSSARAAQSVRMDAAACGTHLIYVASYNNTVQIFNQSGPRQGACGSISGLSNPQGLFVDASGDLWVVNQGPKQILEFPPGGQMPMLTLSDPSGYPVDVAVDNHSGTVYVSNFFQNGSEPGAIEVYPKGATSPTATLSDPNMQYAFYDAVDDKGNLYVTYLEGGNFAPGQVDEWTGGTGSPTNLGITLKAPGGIATTKSGALLICDQSAPACGQFAPGSTTMTNLFATKESDPFAVALGRTDMRAYVEDPGSGKFYAYNYPGPDRRPKSAIAVTGGAYAGIAVSPAAPEGKPW
jgi:DNA-binding beta-propeller fold protein YncE